MRNLVRDNPRFFLAATLAGLLLRLTFFFWVPRVTDDSLFYADLAKNWLQHGVYGTTEGDHAQPTFSRLPGYPAFVAVMFAVSGRDNYRPLMLVQIVMDLGACFLIGDLARRCISDRAAKAAFLLSALCPFFANYASAVLAETLSIFFTAAALDLAVAALNRGDEPANALWAGCGLSTGACLLLRPDGGLLLAAIGLYLGVVLAKRLRAAQRTVPIVRGGMLVALLALLPLGFWGMRNWHTLHRLEFLAPRYANQEDEVVPLGFNRWTKTWIADYVSTEEIYWNVPGEEVDAAKLPNRAFDSPDQRQKTYDIFEAYNQDKHVTPEIDQQFAELARERIEAHPFRYYVELPLLRIADMWLRPRTEILPPDSRWYEFNDDRRWIVLSLGLGAMNLFYVFAAAGGAALRWRRIAWVGLPVLFIVLRSAFLGSLENPESRYTLECFPAVILLASVWWAGSASDATKELAG